MDGKSREWGVCPESHMKPIMLLGASQVVIVILRVYIFKKLKIQIQIQSPGSAFLHTKEQGGSWGYAQTQGAHLKRTRTPHLSNAYACIKYKCACI